MFNFLYFIKTLISFTFSDFPGPSILKTEYLLERTGGAYSEIEVIPGNSASPMYAIPSFPMEYKLVSVTSPDKKFDTTSPVGDIKTPKECTSGVLGKNAPDSFFCMDKRTGKIYTTNAIAGKLDSDVEFRFQIRVYNRSIYPIRDRELTVILTSVDPCKTVTPLYKDLQQGCVRYATVPLSKNTVSGDAYTFDMPADYQRIVALRVPLSNLQLQSGDMGNMTNKLNLSAIITGYNANGTQVMSNKPTYSLYYLEDIDLVISTPVSFLGSTVMRLNITLMEGSTTVEPIVVGNKRTSAVESIQLMYLDRFFCSDVCAKKFNVWRTRSNQLKVEKCMNDRMFYARNFDVCKGKDFYLVIFFILFHSTYQVWYFSSIERLGEEID